MDQGLLDQFRIDLHLGVGFRQTQHSPDALFLHAAEMEQQAFVDQRAEPHPPAHRLDPVHETEQILEDLFDFFRLAGHHFKKLQPVPVVRFARQQPGGAADGSDRVADAVGELGGHVAHRRVPLRLDEQVFVVFQDPGHLLQFLDFALHGHVQAAVVDGQTGLAGETLQGPHPFIQDRFAGDEVVGNDHPERTAGRIEGDHDEAVLLEQAEQLQRHGTVAPAVDHVDGAPVADRTDEQVFLVRGVHPQGVDDTVDLGIGLAGAALDLGEQVVEAHALADHVQPDAPALFAVPRTDGQPPFQGRPGLVEQGEEGAVELQSFLGGDADQDGVEDFVQLDHAQVGCVHLHGQLMRQLDAEIGLFDLALIVPVTDGQPSLFEHLAQGGEQIGEMDGLGEVVVRPVTETDKRRLQIGNGGQHDHRQVRTALFQLGQQLHAVRVGQADVEQDQGHVPGAQMLAQLAGRAGRDRGEAALFEELPQQADNVGKIIDNHQHLIAFQQFVVGYGGSGRRRKIVLGHGRPGFGIRGWARERAAA